MPHQCVKCGNIYDDKANEILKGCSCGARMFFFVKKEKLELMKKSISNLTAEQKAEIEKDVLNMVGQQSEPDQPVILDFESINIVKPGKYEIDLVHLFKKDPLVFKMEEGKYMIDITETFNQFRKKK
jgi:predicted  nucleic acid-binding Zn-ribbon protein